MKSDRLKILILRQTYLHLPTKRADDAWVVTWNSLDLAGLAEVAEVQGHPCLAHWENLAAVAFAGVHCQSSLVAYLRPCHQVLASRFQVEYLTYQWGDELDQSLVVQAGRVDQPASPFVGEAGTGAPDAAFGGHL